MIALGENRKEKDFQWLPTIMRRTIKVLSEGLDNSSAQSDSIGASALRFQESREQCLKALSTLVQRSTSRPNCPCRL